MPLRKKIPAFSIKIRFFFSHFRVKKLGLRFEIILFSSPQKIILDYFPSTFRSFKNFMIKKTGRTNIKSIL